MSFFAKNAKGTPLGVRLIRLFARTPLFSEKRKIELYFPFLFMRVKVVELDPAWRSVKLKLPLTSLSRNANGVLFGGFQAMLADPVAALACARVFRQYACFTRHMAVDFQRGGDSDLELRFEFTAEQEAAIAKDLAANDRATPKFVYGFYNDRNELVTQITNVVAIRPMHYSKARSPPTDPNTFGGSRANQTTRSP
jgi:acyl-coenzyme A thioesterase PaaI-like protein